MINDENYPESRKDGTVEEIFGVTVEDQYRWLEDFTSPESTAWEQNQNKFTEKYLKKVLLLEILAKIQKKYGMESQLVLHMCKMIESFTILMRVIGNIAN